MEHLALYRKYRPQTFGELVGQDDIAHILKTAVVSGRTVHAYLFCGTRGTGKTSTARILAKALNCHHPQEGEPCNECPSCRAITEGRALDVIEIDAASNRGIDEVRDLLEKVHFVPAEGRFKIYIIDEAHMLTNESFNALLKTFEEPPRHVVFILATTEARKIPLTILSRCQRYDFRTVGEEEMLGALRAIAQKENADITDDALEFLTQKAKGSMRDALSLMDQALGETSSTMTAERLSRMLGSVTAEFWPDFLKKMAQGDVVSVFSAIDTVEKDGIDARQFFQDLRRVLGDLLAYGGRSDGSYGRVLNQCRGLFSTEQILDLIAVLGEGEPAFRFNRDARMVCQFLLAKALRILGHGGAAKEAPAAKPQRPAQEKPQPVSKERPEDLTPPWETAPAVPKGKNDSTPPWEVPKVEARPAPTPVASSEDDDLEELWSRIAAAVKKKSPKTYTWLSRGEADSLKNDVLTVSYHKNDGMYQARMEMPEHTNILKEVLQELLGRPIQVRIGSETPSQTGEQSLFDLN